MESDILIQKQRISIIRVFFCAINLLWKYVGPIRLAAIIATTILSGIMPACSLYASKLVLDAVTDLITIGFDTVGFSSLYFALVVKLSVLVVGFWISQINGYISFRSSMSLSLSMNSEILRKASDLDYCYFDNPDFHDVMSRAQSQAGSKPLMLLNRIMSILRNIVTFISMAGLILSLSVPLLGIMILVALPVLFVQIKYGQHSYQLQYDRTQDRRMTSFLSGQIISRMARPEVLSLGIVDYLYNKWFKTAKRFRDEDIRLKTKFTLIACFMESFVLLSQVGSMGYIVYLAIFRLVKLTVGDVMMYTRAFGSGMSVFRSMLSDMATFYQDALFLNDLITFNRLVEENQRRRTQQRLSTQQRDMPAVVERIEFENVSFVYPGFEKPVLKNVNLTFNGGESCLIVGTNGAGKTTLIKLLIRLYDPTSGRILINGVDARHYNIVSLRQAIGVIFQNYLQFPFPAKVNIGIGCKDAIEDMARIKAAARRARADDFIDKLPTQYDTVLSRMFDGGTQLSVGQWQRICLSRLFMKNSQVFVLDEPTASLDVETEVHLLREITQLARDRLCILISHRSLRRGVADRIVVLEDGFIDEEGTYDELVARNGSFARLSKLYHTMGEDNDNVGSMVGTERDNW